TAPEKRAAHYRERCLRCHEQQGCRLPTAKRSVAGQPDNCIACHMPPVSTADVPHVAITDHRILRSPDKSAKGPLYSGSPSEFPFVRFHQGPVDPEDLDATRDLGVALTTLAQVAPGSERRLCLIMRPYLEKAVETWPDDYPAREALVSALSIAGRPHEAFAVCEGTLEREP